MSSPESHKAEQSHPWLPEPFIAAISSATFGDKPRRDEALSGHTTSRLGGPADVWLAVTNLAELIEATKLARQHNVPVFMLGAGANLLISEAGIRGLVIENRANLVQFSAPAKMGEPATLIVESGVVLPSLARRCAKRGLSGLEWAVGVPGTIGGAVVNNAGAYGSDIAATLIRAELLSPAGERVWQPVSWFAYGYRTSCLKRQPPSRSGGNGVKLSPPGPPKGGERNRIPPSGGLGGPESAANLMTLSRSGEGAGKSAGWIVLQAELHITRSPVNEIEAQMNVFNERRKSSQPPGATMGSMFKNPPGDYAGRLIEAAGLKGHQIGQAQISPVHANFFQNLGGATATDMLALIEIAQATVQAKFGIKLELEIEVIDEFSQKAS